MILRCFEENKCPRSAQVRRATEGRRALEEALAAAGADPGEADSDARGPSGVDGDDEAAAAAAFGARVSAAGLRQNRLSEPTGDIM
jgi:hypothetical protein